jgi:Rrf2 family protein
MMRPVPGLSGAFGKEVIMKKVTTKGHYGMRLMVNLARKYRKGQTAVPIKEIAEEEGLSMQYLQQMTIPLQINGLIKSARGSRGGHILARKPSEIKLCEILQALEGSCGLVECVDDAAFCERTGDCGLYEVWKGASDLLHDYFDKHTLQDILDIGDRKSAAESKKAKSG